MTEAIKSPLTLKENITQIGTVNTDEIISIYQKYYGMDISAYFADIEDIKIFKCLDTKYMFYYPFSTEGDEKYYSKMSEFEWYYHPSRWEHMKAREIILPGSKVLEVGSGSGHFIKELNKMGVKATGLELNGNGIKEAKKIGVELLKETVQDHADNNKEGYDIVCSFQVLEHISQPLSFLKAKINCLKPGGKLIIGVPNNDSYIKNNKLYSKVLNMPPHHVGLWTADSIRSLQKLFRIELNNIYYEPLIDGNVQTYLWNKVNSFFLGMTFFNRVIWKLKIDKPLTYLLSKRKDDIIGNSMLAIYTKN